MPPAPGQQSGQAAFSWREFVDSLVAERGSIAQAALHLAEHRSFAEDVESVERGLRRLRDRGTRPGGVWGQRVLRCFGLPGAVNDRVRWMGQYHSRFSDLPVSLCDELLRPWDRPPVSVSAARIWLLLGQANVALRRRDKVQPILLKAGLMEARSEGAARVELALVQAYAWHRSDADAAQRALQRAGDLLESEALAEPDRACLFARWIDQSAYPLNKPRSGDPDHAAAEALYERIPADGPLFALCRRENGLGWSRFRLGDRKAAAAHARTSVQAAGDSGSLRMRAMALNLLAAVTRGAKSSAARQRAEAIAKHLEDEALLVRFTRAAATPTARRRRRR